MKNKTNKMKVSVLCILCILSMIPMTLAFYPGQIIIEENTIGTENLVWTIIENSSDILVLPVVEINKTYVKIFFPYNIPPNNFTIVFLEQHTQEVVKEVHSGGGRGTKIVIKNNTKYIEIPNYITEYDTSSNETESIIIDSSVNDKNNSNLIIYFLIGIIIFIITCSLFIFYKMRNTIKGIKNGNK